VQFFDSVDCKNYPLTHRNHAIFAKHIWKGSGCRWCTYYHTLRKYYNIYPQPPPFTKLPILQMQNETTDYCCQNFLKIKV